MGAPSLRSTGSSHDVPVIEKAMDSKKVDADLLRRFKALLVAE